MKQQDPEFVRKIFASIAKRYDLANHVLSGGLDFLWRAKASRLVAANAPKRVLDLATGSGDLLASLKSRCNGAVVYGADFCLPMLHQAKAKGIGPLVQADALHLPFQSQTFDAVTVAFGLRNMADHETALVEMARILSPGGMILIMDFSMPWVPIVRPIYRAYLHRTLPWLAGKLTGQREAYDYLGESIESFPRDQGMKSLLESCGFTEVRQWHLALGIASIYRAFRA